MRRTFLHVVMLCAGPLLAAGSDPAPTGTIYRVEAKVLSVAAGALGTNGFSVTADSITVSTNGQWNTAGKTDEAGELLGRLAKAEGVDVLSAPQVVMRAGQAAQIEIGRQIAYLAPETNVLYRVRHRWFADDEVEAISNGLYRMQALDEEKNPGISIAVTVTPAGEGCARADVKFRYNLLSEMTALPGTTLKMGPPVVESRKIQAAVVAKLGDWVAFGGAQKVLNKGAVRDALPLHPFRSGTKGSTREEHILVFLRVTEVDPATLESDAPPKGLNR